MSLWNDVITLPRRAYDWFKDLILGAPGTKEEKAGRITSQILSPFNPQGARDYQSKLYAKYTPLSLRGLLTGGLRANPNASKTFSAFLINNRK